LDTIFDRTFQSIFAFGHGLSYTKFKISDIKTDKKSYTGTESIKLSCIVSNAGSTSGAEVVQVYIGKPKSRVERALKELKGYKKVNLVAGSTSNAEIVIDVQSLSYYDESKSDWNLEKGEYIIYVGNASDAISQKLKITIK